MNTLTRTISRDIVADALETAGLTETVGTVNDTYSGRNMGRETCLSFVFDGGWPQRRLCRFMVELALWAQEAYELADDLEAPDMARNLADVVSTDNLGMDTIVYFPGWKLND